MQEADSSVSADSGVNINTLLKLNQIFLLILLRYKDYIEEKENISVAELPTLVTPKNAFVAKKANEIKSSISNYIYELNFNEAALKAFKFVCDEIEETVLPLQFWLTPEETLKFRMGDITDKSILLCSLFIALGNPSSKVIVALGNKKIISIYYEFSNVLTLFDIQSKSMTVYASKEDLLAKLIADENVSAYEFNDQIYLDIA
ncbi:MAG: hypothetical protein QXD11_02535 [Candidatus Micrarchaeaceae archaeon]